MIFIKLSKRFSNPITFFIFIVEILIGLLGILKISFLSFDLTKINEATFKALKHNTITLQYLAEGKSKGLDYSKEIEERIIKASNEILSFYGKIIPSCFFKQGEIPDFRGNLSGIKFKDLTMSIHYEGPAGSLVDMELSEGISRGDRSKCDNTKVFHGFLDELKNNFRYGNIIEWILGILGIFLVCLKWKEYGLNSGKKMGKRKGNNRERN